ncbi:MAG: hypothetical protein JRN24_00230 [Nitrososphaerota archaeon]|nr:hypothetical protein [Nitrososphaerota archaeon]
MEFNVYLDGSWLFKQCDYDRVLAKGTEDPWLPFRLDFKKLVALISEKAKSFGGGGVATPKRLYICTSIFKVPSDAETWPSTKAHPETLAKLRTNLAAREDFVQRAFAAGFLSDGVLRPELRPFHLALIGRGRWHEKQVDTWLVALLVEQAIRNPEYFHFLASGDADMMPGVKRVVPDYTQRVVHVGTHPVQFEREDQETSFEFEGFGLENGPILLEDHLEQLIEGTHVYRCRNRSCNRVFVRPSRIPPGQPTFCTPCDREKAHGKRF